MGAEQYTPPPGVIGYIRKDELARFLADDSSWGHVGLDHARCWEDEPPYHTLIALCAIDSVQQHNAIVINRVADRLEHAGAPHESVQTVRKMVYVLSCNTEIAAYTPVVADLLRINDELRSKVEALEFEVHDLKNR